MEYYIEKADPHHDGKIIDLVIGTTATTRGDFHRPIFEKYVQFLEGFNILWYLNIDELTGLNLPSVNYTIDLLDSIIKPYSNNISIFYTSKNGGTRESFYNSAHLIANAMMDHRPTKGFLWLEDDWLLYENITLMTILQKYPNFGDDDYLQLAKRNGRDELSFNPGLWGYNLFRDIVHRGIQKPYHRDNANPERACVFPHENVINYVNVFYKMQCFKDCGRQWTSSKNLFRTFQY